MCTDRDRVVGAGQPRDVVGQFIFVLLQKVARRTVVRTGDEVRTADAANVVDRDER